MRKEHTIKKVEEYKVLDSIICDICHKEYKVSYNDFEISEFFSFNTEGGFGSVFGDGEKIQFDICQYCIKRFLDNNKKINL
jgi:antitoxin CcdA